MVEPFTLQWHITDTCLLRCAHCYRDRPASDLQLADLERILSRFHDFCTTRHLTGRVTFAGGEPLLRAQELIALMERARSTGLQVHLLTNGLLITPELASQLKHAGCLRVQVSLDGDRPVHESVRGPGTFAGAMAALEMLRAAGLAVTISMTVGRWNFQDLDQVIRLAGEQEARLFVSRFVPFGVGAAHRDELVPARHWRSVMLRCRQFACRHAPGVALRDPLYVPLLEKGSPGHALCVRGCAIGYGGVAVESNGDVYPCRRLPIVLGNLLRDSFEQVWHSPVLEALRDRDRLRGRCGRCRWRRKCGGCRAIAYALTGDWLSPDPQCCWPRTWTTGFWVRPFRCSSI